MTDLEGTVLRGLPGDNPLGFLAALGVQVALDDQGVRHRLHWTDDPIPRPVVSPALDFQDVANAALAVASAWLDGPALDKAIGPKLKLRRPHIRDYLRRGRDAGSSGALAFCLLAEDSLDNSENAKPSDLYFTAGQQKFVSMARTILAEVTVCELVEDIGSAWRYRSRRDSLMWDSTDDRLHAHSAADPTSAQNPKLTNPGGGGAGGLGSEQIPVLRLAARNPHPGLLGWLETRRVRVAAVDGPCDRSLGSVFVGPCNSSRRGWPRRQRTACRLVPGLGTEPSHAVADPPQLAGRIRHLRSASRGLAA